MTGSSLFSIEKSGCFERSFKKLAKVHRAHFVNHIAEILESLMENPYPQDSRREPLPDKVQLPAGWAFYKLEIWIARGASGQVRLMYLVNEGNRIIQLVWIYSHEQFKKRPSDSDLRAVLKEILDF